MRLPDALGDPGARRAMTEVLIEVAGEAGDLFALVLGRDGDEDGFVKAAADQLDLPSADEGLEANEIFGTILFDPGKQRAGIVEAHVNAGMLFKRLNERQVGVFVSLFEHVAEIAAGLVGVNQQDEMKAL